MNIKEHRNLTATYMHDSFACVLNYNMLHLNRVLLIYIPCTSKQGSGTVIIRVSGSWGKALAMSLYKLKASVTNLN